MPALVRFKAVSRTIIWISETANSTSLAPIGSFFNLLQEDEDQHYQNEKFYTATPGNLPSSGLM